MAKQEFPACFFLFLFLFVVADEGRQKNKRKLHLDSIQRSSTIGLGQTLDKYEEIIRSNKTIYRGLTRLIENLKQFILRKIT